MNYKKICTLIILAGFGFSAHAMNTKPTRTGAELFSKGETSALKGLGYGTLGLINLGIGVIAALPDNNNPGRSLAQDVWATVMSGAGFWMLYKSICALKEADQQAGLDNKSSIKARILRLSKAGMISTFAITFLGLLYTDSEKTGGLLGTSGLPRVSLLLYLLSNLGIYAHELYKTGKEVNEHDKRDIINLFQ